MSGLTCAKAPCGTCPYRPDVPSGLWHESEYEKLAEYDGDIAEQLAKGALAPFHCHQSPELLCAGWVGCHDMENNLAVRLRGQGIDWEAVTTYVSPVPLFSSGAEAAEHGMRDIESPGVEARKKAVALRKKLRKRRPRQRTR